MVVSCGGCGAQVFDTWEIDATQICVALHTCRRMQTPRSECLRRPYAASPHRSRIGAPAAIPAPRRGSKRCRGRTEQTRLKELGRAAPLLCC